MSRPWVCEPYGVHGQHAFVRQVAGVRHVDTDETVVSSL